MSETFKPVPLKRDSIFGEYGSNVPLHLDILVILEHWNELGTGGRPEVFRRCAQEIKELRKLRDRQTAELNTVIEQRRIAENLIIAAAETIKR